MVVVSRGGDRGACVVYGVGDGQAFRVRDKRALVGRVAVRRCECWSAVAAREYAGRRRKSAARYRLRSKWAEHPRERRLSDPVRPAIRRRPRWHTCAQVRGGCAGGHRAGRPSGQPDRRSAYVINNAGNGSILQYSVQRDGSLQPKTLPACRTRALIPTPSPSALTAAACTSSTRSRVRTRWRSTALSRTAR
jgi:hypothetical protein